MVTMKRALILSPLLAAVLIGAQAPVHVAGDRTITLTATAEGTQPFAYQWHRNGAPLPGETKAVLIITDAKATGVYHCVISNSAGSTQTPPVRLGNTAQTDAAEITITRKQK
jgi:hypothetical protein